MPNKPIIRPATADDLRTIQDLNYELFKHDAAWISHLNMDWPYDPATGGAYFNGAIEKPDATCFVAEAGSQIVGYIAGSIKKPESYRKLVLAELENMFVREAYRGQGVGKQLVAAFRQWCAEHGVQKILVIASEPNESAIKFYEAVGFKPYSLELEMDLEDSVQ